LALAQVALTAFDTVIILAYIALWFIDGPVLYQIMQRFAGISLLLAVAPIIIGAMMVYANKKAGEPMPGTAWANYGVVAGMALALLTLAIPLLFMFRSIFSNPGLPG
jgi:hypothetical protein